MDKFQELIKEKLASIEQLDVQISAKKDTYNEELRELQTTKESERKLRSKIQAKNSKKEELKFYENKNILIYCFKKWLKVNIADLKKDYQEKKIVSVMLNSICLLVIFGCSFFLSKIYGNIFWLIIPSSLVLILYVVPVICGYLVIRKFQKKNSLNSLETEIEELSKELEILRSREEKSITRINNLKAEKSNLKKEKSQAEYQLAYIQSMFEQALKSVDAQTILNQKFDSMNVETELKLILEKKEGDK